MTGGITRTDLLGDFAALRHGWGVEATNLRARIGPNLAQLCDIPPDAGDRQARELLVAAVRRFGHELPQPDRQAIDFALGIDPAVRFRFLKDRIDQLAGEICNSERTARRRIDRAFHRLAEEMLAQRYEPDPEQASPDTGWRVRTFDALLRLDSPTPELIEKRTIVATRAELHTIAARFSLPRQPMDNHAETELHTDVLQGARIVGRERQGEGHFRYLLRLPRTLARGEHHTYTIVFRLPPGQPMRTHYAFVPLVYCEQFRARIRFDPDHPPAVVWKLEHLPPRVMADQLSPGDPLELDGAAEAELEFRDMRLGFGYGIAWLPGPDHHQAE